MATWQMHPVNFANQQHVHPSGPNSLQAAWMEIHHHYRELSKHIERMACQPTADQFYVIHNRYTSLLSRIEALEPTPAEAPRMPPGFVIPLAPSKSALPDFPLWGPPEEVFAYAFSNPESHEISPPMLDMAMVHHIQQQQLQVLQQQQHQQQQQQQQQRQHMLLQHQQQQQQQQHHHQQQHLQQQPQLQMHAHMPPPPPPPRAQQQQAAGAKARRSVPHVQQPDVELTSSVPQDLISPPADSTQAAAAAARERRGRRPTQPKESPSSDSIHTFEEDDSDSDEKHEKRKRKKSKEKKNPIAQGMACKQCFTTETPEWRRGPDGSHTLCNACGLRFSKQQRRLKMATMEASMTGPCEDPNAVPMILKSDHVPDESVPEEHSYVPKSPPFGYGV